MAVLSRGFDQTDVEHVILARPLKKSFSEHVQMAGRGARIHDGKQLCVIQDNSGNWLRFQDDWDELFHRGVATLARQFGVRFKDSSTFRESAERRLSVLEELRPKVLALQQGAGEVKNCRSTKKLQVEQETAGGAGA